MEKDLPDAESAINNSQDLKSGVWSFLFQAALLTA